MREHWRDYYFEGSKNNCDDNCPHLRVSTCPRGKEVAHCDFYDENLAFDGSVYGKWFMCGDCVDATYGGGDEG